MNASFNSRFKSPKSNQKEKNKGKGKAPSKGLMDNEERAIAQAWLDVSENLAMSDNQDSITIKNRVWISFCVLMKKEHHNANQLYLKWRTTNKALLEFNDIYMNATYNMQSSANEVDVIAKARQIYKAKVDRAFANDAFWEGVKNKPKWLALKSIDDFASMSKRS